MVGDNGTESKYRGSAVFSNVCAVSRFVIKYSL